MTRATKRPFWLHQAAEYVIGLAAVGAGLQSPDPTLPAVMGGLVLVNAALAEGPLGAFRLVGRRWHRWTDVMVLAALTVVAVVADTDLSTRLVQIGLIIVLAVVIMGTDYREAAEIRRRSDDEGLRSTDIGRRAGRYAGSLAARARDTAQRRGRDS